VSVGGGELGTVLQFIDEGKCFGGHFWEGVGLGGGVINCTKWKI